MDIEDTGVVEDPTKDFIAATSRCIKAAQRVRLDGADVPGRIENVVYEREGELHEAAELMWRFRSSFETAFGERWSQAFRAVDVMLGFSASALTILIDPKLKLDDNILRSNGLLLSRACVVGHEILALLRAGFTDGAYARWRTLYETAVFARVFFLGDANTAKRYVRHQIVRAAADLDSINSRGHDAELDIDSNRQLRADTRLYLRRYGRHFGSDYGWASTLTKKAKPTFKDLKVLANLYTSDGLHDRSHMHDRSHKHVHAGAYGDIANVNGDGYFHIGPDPKNVGPLAAATIDTLGEVVSALARRTEKYTRLRGPFAVHLVANELSLTLGRDSYAADEAATRRAYQSEKFDPIADILAELMRKSS